MVINKSFLIIFSVIFLSSCSSVKKEESNGCAIPEEELSHLLVNKSNIKDVLQNLGSPSVRSNLDNSKNGTWIYYNQTKESYLFFDPKVVDKNIIAIDFNERGIIKDIRRYSGSNIKDIIRVPEITKAKEENPNIVMEILQNVGGIAGEDSDIGGI